MIRQSLNRITRLLHCKGCGAKYQTNDPNDWGFKQDANMTKKESVREKLHSGKYSSIYENLSPIQRQALQFTPPELEIEEFSSAQVISAEKAKKKQEKFETFCRPCIDAQDGRSLPLKPSKYDVFSRIPKDATVMHVIDSFDFPSSMVSDLVDRPNTHYIISRADLVLTHANQLSRFKEYAMEQVFNQAGIPASKVHVLSAKKEWGFQSVLEALSDETYLVGKTNGGKSTLASYLSGKPAKYWPLPFKSQYPGYHSFGNRTIVDTPSIPESYTPTGIYSLLKPSHIRKIVSGKMMLSKRNHYNIEPTVVKPGQTISLGGLVGIEVPKSARGNATHVWAVHGVSGQNVNRALSSIEKIPEINTSDHPAHQGWSMTSGPQPLVHLFDTQVSGVLELVIRGLGPVFIKSFGKYTEPNVVRVSALPGVDVMERNELLPWILHKKSKRVFRGEASVHN